MISLLSNEAKTVDIIIFDNSHLKLYEDYLQNVKAFPQYLGHYTNYLKKAGEKVSKFNGRTFSLPLHIDYGVLYSNRELLDYHGKNPPETWDELINTAEYIIKEEEKKGNKIIGYSSLMTDSDSLVSSIYEFIYSFRDKIDDDIPDLLSQNSIKALEKLYEIKKKISSDQAFKLTASEIHDKMVNGTILFSRGCKISGMSSIYNNETFCNEAQINCNIYNNAQTIPKPFNLMNNYEDYITEFMNYANEYLFSKENDESTAYKALERIDRISRVYYIDYNSDIGRISLIAPTALIILMLILYSLTFKHNIGKNFIFLSKRYWLTYIFGISLMLSYLYTNIGTLTNFKCQIRTILLSVGFTLTSTLQCLKLLSNMPSKSNYVGSVKKNFPIILNCIIWIDIFFCSLFLSVSYKNNINYIIDNVNFQKCQFLSLKSRILILCLLGYKLIVIFINFALTYIEWNNELFKIDVRSILFTHVFSLIFIVTFAGYYYTDSNDLNKYYLIRNLLVLLYCILIFSLNFLTKFFISSTHFENKNINNNNYGYSYSNNELNNKNENPNNLANNRQEHDTRKNEFKEKMKSYNENPSLPE
ncbi:hypothetical protein BCR32DRAFT_245898 [Anaeromyces robustus]|uniref:Uncharacterized protein n=1 Tax=Anaeromyces robustus TaxID=1754192 RepID=A0A1Y1X2Q3_9FUNG|nr:hypothetical protein BCR32DRAFT_245898 [Anaeromyces robustus]|eukprot:ORX80089.1 hypothetical protein BCR32DRAFT_245898 [Anaeromyces robustus]